MLSLRLAFWTASLFFPWSGSLTVYEPTSERTFDVNAPIKVIGRTVHGLDCEWHVCVNVHDAENVVCAGGVVVNEPRTGLFEMTISPPPEGWPSPELTLDFCDVFTGEEMTRTIRIVRKDGGKWLVPTPSKNHSRP